MSVKLGRVGYDIELISPDKISISPGHISLSHSGFPVSGTDGPALARQLNGLGDQPDLFHPFIWDADDSLTCFVKVADVKVDYVKLAAGMFAYSIELERMPSATIEEVVLGGLRPNDNGITDSGIVPWHAVPEAALGYTNNTDLESFTRAADDADVTFYDEAGSAPFTDLLNANPAFQLTPEDFLDSACEIRQGPTALTIPGSEAFSAITASAVYFQQQTGIASGATFTSGTVTPTANRRLFARVSISGSAFTGTVPTLTGLGLTWKKIAVLRADETAAQRTVNIYVAQQGATVTPGALSFTAPTGATWAISIEVTQYANVYYLDSPFDGLRQYRPIRTATNTTDPSIDFDKPADANSMMVGFFTVGQASATWSLTAGGMSEWSILTQQGPSSPAVISLCVVTATGTTDTTATVHESQAAGSPTVLMVEMTPYPTPPGDRWSPVFHESSSTALVSSSGDATVEWPPHSKYGYIDTDDYASVTGLLMIESRADEPVNTGHANLTGWTVVGTPNPSGAGTPATSTQLTLLRKRMTSTSEADVVVPDVGTGMRAAIITFRNCGSFEASTNSDVDPTSTAVLVTGTTSLTDNALIVYVTATAVSTSASNEANGSVTGLVERFDQGLGTNGGGGIVVWTGLKATAGATGALTATTAATAVMASTALSIAASIPAPDTSGFVDTIDDWPVVTGFQTDQTEPGALSIGNHLVKMVTLGQDVLGHTSGFGFAVGAWDGTAWRWKSFVLNTNKGPSDTTGAVVSDPIAVVAYHNRPEFCSIGFQIAEASNNRLLSLTFSIRRGSRYLDCYIEADRAFIAGGISLSGQTWQIARWPTTEAEEVITGGVKADIDDENGDRYVIISPSSITGSPPATGGASWQSAVIDGPLNFAIGLEISGNSSVEPDRAADLVAQYHAAQWVKQTVTAS